MIDSHGELIKANKGDKYIFPSEPIEKRRKQRKLTSFKQNTLQNLSTFQATSVMLRNN